MKNFINAKSKNVEVFVVLVTFILACYRGYDYVNVVPYLRWFKLIAFALLAYMVFVGTSTIHNKAYRIELYIIASTCLTILFAVPSNVFSNLYKYLPYLSFLALFYLVAKRPSLSTVEKVLMVMAFAYLACWIYQISQVPNIVFGGDHDDQAGSESRSFFRFYIATKEHLPFLVFYFLAVYNRKKNPIYLILAIVAFSAVVLHVARQMLFWTGLMAVSYYIITNKKDWKKLTVFAVVISLFSYYVLINISAFSKLYEMTFETTSTYNGLDTENIRLKAMSHFVETYNNTPISAMFGSGIETKGTALYRKLNFSSMRGYYLDDVGFVALYIHFGLAAVVLYLLLIFKVLFKTSVANEYIYLKFYISYLVLSYIGSHALTSNLIFWVLSIYILKSSSNKLKVKEEVRKYSSKTYNETN